MTSVLFVPLGTVGDPVHTDSLTAITNRDQRSREASRAPPSFGSPSVGPDLRRSHRWSLLLRAALRRALPARLGRFALGALLTTTVVGLVLAIPVDLRRGARRPRWSSTRPRRGGRPVGELAGRDGHGRAPGELGGLRGRDDVGDVRLRPPSRAPRPPPARPLRPRRLRGPSPSRLPRPRPPRPRPPRRRRRAARRARPRARRRPLPARGRPRPRSPPGTRSPAGRAVESPAELSDPAAEALALVNAERDARVRCPGGGRGSRGRGAGAQCGDERERRPGPRRARGRGRTGSGRALRRRRLARGPPASATLLDCSRTAAGIAVVDGWWTALPA